MNLETGDDHPDWHLLGFQDNSAVLQSPLGVIHVRYEPKADFVRLTHSLNKRNGTTMDATSNVASQRCAGKRVLLKKLTPNGKYVIVNGKSLGSTSLKSAQQLIVRKIDAQTNGNFYKIKLPNVLKNGINYFDCKQETAAKSDQLHGESSKDVCQSLSTDNRYPVRTNTLSLALGYDNGGNTTEPVREKLQFDKSICSSDVQFVKSEPRGENAGNLIFVGNVALPKLNGAGTVTDVKLNKVNKLVPPLKEESRRGINVKCNREVIPCLAKVTTFLEVPAYSSANGKFPPKATEVDDSESADCRDPINQTGDMGKIKHFKEKTILQENDKNANSMNEKQIKTHVNDKYSTNAKDVRNSSNSDAEDCGAIKSRRVRRKRIKHSQYIQQQIEKYMRIAISRNSKRYRNYSGGKPSSRNRNRSQDFSCQVSTCCKSLDKSRANIVESNGSLASRSTRTVDDLDIDIDISEMLNDVNMGYGLLPGSKVVYGQIGGVDEMSRHSIPASVHFHNANRNSQQYHYDDHLSAQDNNDRLEFFKKLTSCTAPDLMGNL